MTVQTAISTDATAIYREGQYARLHADWHIRDAPAKAQDLLPAMEALAENLSGKPCLIADVGTGVGGVPVELRKRLANRLPHFSPAFVGYEIAAEAVQTAHTLFPDLEIRNRHLSEDDGRFDAVMFVDVLEHLESGWEMLRLASRISDYLIVRQPLLDNFGLFRGNKYGSQRATLGHISYFNYRSFLDMASATGWMPLQLRLAAPWEIGGPCDTGGTRGMRPVKRLLTHLSRENASFLLEGFYLIGIFRKS